MTLEIKYLTGTDYKHLLWVEDDILKCNISEFRVCDCFVEWGVAFLRKYSNVNLSNQLM